LPVLPGGHGDEGFSDSRNTSELASQPTLKIYIFCVDFAFWALYRLAALIAVSDIQK
jgi:hypothetical protein